MADVVVPIYWNFTNQIQLSGQHDVGKFTLRELTMPTGESFRLEPPLEIIQPDDADGFLEEVPSGSGTWVFRQQANDTLVGSTSFVVAEVESFLGLGVDVDATLTAQLTIRVPPLGSEAEAFATFDLSAHVEVGAGSGNFCPDIVSFSVTIRDLPTAQDAQGPPELWFGLPDIGLPVPRLPVPWSFPPSPPSWFPVRWSAYSANLRGVDVRVGWESLLLEVTATGFTLTFERLFVESPTGRLEADVVLAVKGGSVDVAASSIRLRGEKNKLPLNGWHVSEGCFAVQWTGRQFANLLTMIAPGFDSKVLVGDANIAVRVLTANRSVSEIRIDVTAAPQQFPVELPGFGVSLPAGKLFSVVYSSADGPDPAPPQHTVAALVTVDENTVPLPSQPPFLGPDKPPQPSAGSFIKAASTFTWTRFDDRELQNDAQESAPPDPLIAAIVIRKEEPITLALFELPQGQRPRMLRHCDTEVAPIWKQVVNDAGDEVWKAQCHRTPWQTFSLDSKGWAFRFALSEALLKKFEMPFLRGETNGIGQVVRVRDYELNEIDFQESTVRGELTLEFIVGPLMLSGPIKMSFNWETFAFEVDHGEGLDLTLQEDQEFNFLGLIWTFKKRLDGKPFFKLVTADADYKLIQLDGSEIELRYTRATTEDQPIVFTVSNFEISEAGIGLTADVTEDPAKLNGLETEFRFTEGRFQIKENRILSFSIAGGGPLPPALVGEANAAITLQFEQQGDTLALVRGAARVDGKKIAYCKSNRFEFTLESLTLEFVDDGSYHLFFRVTATAEYKPQRGDDNSGLLGWLPGVQIRLVDCPLTGNARVIAEHVKFKVKLQEPAAFDIFGCFQMEIRGFGFLPQCDKFDGDGALVLSGQLLFAQGGGDAISGKFDFHDLYIGLPESGSLVPRFYMKGLGLMIQAGNVKLGASVSLIEKGEEVAPGLPGDGFRGKGYLHIGGLPPIDATFAFLRVRRPEDGRWVRAWFIYLEARQMSFKIPVVEIFLREVGLGLGYRYTLAGIKTADQIDDVKLLIGELKRISRTQGNLADHRSWAVDVEPPGQKPRITVALRGLFSQTSAAKTAFEWNQEKEKKLACLFLLDAVVALRSDLTFFMVARGWLNTNYAEFRESVDSPGGTLHRRPLVSGYVLLSPRQKRFLAHVASNPEGEFGNSPPVPDFLKRAVKQSRFSATLLIEPGLVHAELGWPNMLQWSDGIPDKNNPILMAEFRGGAIFRTSRDELVTGLSYLATGKLKFDAHVDAGWVGASLSATASVSYGARYIGVLDYNNLSRSAFYGGIGVEIDIRVSVKIWVEIDTWLGSYTDHWNIGFDINFTASLEVGVLGNGSMGLQGSGTFTLNTRWKSLHFSVGFKVNDGAVKTARRITERFLHIGLEATDVDAIPGVSRKSRSTFESLGGAPVEGKRRSGPRSIGVEQLSRGNGRARSRSSLAGAGSADDVGEAITAGEVASGESAAAEITAEEAVSEFVAPDYILLQKVSRGTAFFTLLPRDSRQPMISGPRAGMITEGFFAVPPSEGTDVVHDYAWTLPQLDEDVIIQQFLPESGTWQTLTPDQGIVRWKMAWNQPYQEHTEFAKQDGSARESASLRVKHLLRTGYLGSASSAGNPQDALDSFVPERDPAQWPEEGEVTDERMDNPSDAAFESAVRGAQEQFESAPYFRHDVRRSRYSQQLAKALDQRHDIYGTNKPFNALDPDLADAADEPTQDQQAIQLRSVVLQQMVADLRQRVEAYSRGEAGNFEQSVGGMLGMTFRIMRSSRMFAAGDLVPHLNSAGSQAAKEAIAGALGLQVDIRVDEIEADALWQVTDRRVSLTLVRIDDNTLCIPAALRSIEDSLQANGDSEDWGKIWQRRTVDEVEPVVTGVEGRQVTLYNSRQRSFAVNRARAEDIRKFEHEHTIALGWKLTWSVEPTDDDNADDRDALQNDSPEDHLAYYQVTRRRLDDATSETQFKVRSIDPLVREPKAGDEASSYVVQRIRSHFQIVNHFPPETSGPLTRPVQYLYTVTPVAMDGTLGQTRTILAKRPPSVPPPVPTDTRFEVLYSSDRPAEFLQEDRFWTTEDSEHLVDELNSNGPFERLHRLRSSVGLAALPGDAAVTVEPLEQSHTWRVQVKESGEGEPVVEKSFHLYFVKAEGNATGAWRILGEADSQFQRRRQARIQQPDRILVRWTQPEVAVGQNAVGVDRYRLLFRRSATLPAGYYGVDSDARGVVNSGTPATNARPLRTDRVMHWKAAVGETARVRVRELDGQAVFFTHLHVEELRELGVLPPADGTANNWRPEAWEIFFQTESETGVRSSLTPVQVVLQFASQEKIDRIRIHENQLDDRPIPPNESDVEQREAAILEWMARPVLLPTLPAHDAGRRIGYAFVPQPTLAESWRIADGGRLVELRSDAAGLRVLHAGAPDVLPAELKEVLPNKDTGEVEVPAACREALAGVGIDLTVSARVKRKENIGKFLPVGSPLSELAFDLHPDGHRAVRFVFNQGPSGDSKTPLDLHAGFRLLRFDALAHSPDRLDPGSLDTWERFIRQADLQTVQEIELAPADDLDNLPADTNSPRIWEAWYPSEMRRLNLFDTMQKEGRGVEQAETNRSPWFSWRESELVWPDPLVSEPDDPNGLALFRKNTEHGPLFWQRARHALLDEILTRMEFEVLGTVDEKTESEWTPDDGRQLVAELNVKDTDHIDKKLPFLRKLLEDVWQTEPLPEEAFVTVTDPGTRWRVLHPDGSSFHVERRVAVKVGQDHVNRWRLEKLISDGDSAPLLEIIAHPWGTAKTFDEAMAASDNDSDPYGWGLLQRMGLSVTFCLRNPDENTFVDRDGVLQRLQRAVEDSLGLEVFKSFADHLFAEVLYRPDRRMKVKEIHDLPEGSDASDLLTIIQVSLRPRIKKASQYDVWTIVAPADDQSLRGKRVTLRIKRPNSPRPCDVVLNPGVPGASVVVEGTSDDNAATRLPVTIPREGNLKLIFRGGDMPTEVAAVEAELAPEIIRLDEDLPPWEWVSSHFDWPKTDEGDQWRTWFTSEFERYVEALGATHETEAHASFRKANIEKKKKELQGPVREWLVRFFNYSGDADESGTKQSGPWMASAYPRSLSPATVTPDSSGRIAYDHFVDDQLATAARHFVVPRGRYDKLWEFVAGSKVLTDDTAKRRESLERLDALPPLSPGGVDLAFPRIRRVTAPIVKLSSRLDGPSSPGRAAPPGVTWEVILDRHPEQALKESNHQLQARLEFHDVVWSRLRRFAYAARLEELQEALLQRHKSDWGVKKPDSAFLHVPNPDDPKAKLTFRVDGDTLINAEEIAGKSNLKIRAVVRRLRAELAKPQHGLQDRVHVRIVENASGELVLLFSATEDLSIELHDENPDHKLTALGTFKQLLEVRYVEDQLDASVELADFPREPQEPQPPGKLLADDWLEQRGLIKTDVLTPEVRRMLDLPLRLPRGPAGNMVYQFDAIPYFYTQRLLFAARAGHKVSPVTRLDHSDFHYESPIPEALIDGIEIIDGGTGDAVRKRRIEIALARYWDCLATDTQNRWSSESPQEAGTALAVAGTAILAGGRFGTVHRFEDGSAPSVDSRHQGRVTDIKVEPDGSLAASIGQDGVALMWEPGGGKVSQLDISQARCLAWSDQVLAVGDAHGEVHLIDPEDESVTAQRRVFPDGVSALLVDGTGHVICGSAAGQMARVAPDLSSQVLWETGQTGAPAAFAASPDSTRLASVGDDGRLRIWEIASGTVLHETELGVPLTDVVFLSDAKLAVATLHGEVFVGRVDGFDVGGQPVVDHGAGTTRVVATPDGSTLITVGANGRVCRVVVGEPDAPTLGILASGTFASLPDCDVIYQYTLVKPGRVIETVAEVAFDPLQAEGYVARNIGLGYSTEVQLLKPPSLGDPRMRIVTLFGRDPAADPESVTHRASSQHAFGPPPLTGTASFLPPHTYRLHLVGATSEQMRQQADQLLADPDRPVDPSFREAVRQLLRQEADCTRETQVFDRDKSFRKTFAEGPVSLSLVRRVESLGLPLKLRGRMTKLTEKEFKIDDGDRSHRIEVQDDDTVNLSWCVRDNIVDASIGLEQLAELPPCRGVFQESPTPPYDVDRDNADTNGDGIPDWRTVTWVGAMSAEQLRVLLRQELDANDNAKEAGWAVTSDFRSTFNSLLASLQQQEIRLEFAGDAPDPTEIPAELAGRFSLEANGTQEIVWRGLILTPNAGAIEFADKSPEELAELDQINVDALDVVIGLLPGSDFAAKAGALKAQLIGDVGQRVTIEVPIVDATWQPRPTGADLQASFPLLAGALLPRRVVLAFKGVMTQSEARQLRTLAGKSKVGAPTGDQRACDELFTSSVNSGLDGARIEVRTRRKAAAMVSREVDAVIDD